MISLVLTIVAISALVASYAVRVWIYRDVDFDRVATPLLKNTPISSFADALWIHLYREKDRIDAKFRPKIVAYFWLSIVGIILVVAAVAAHALAT